MAKKTSTTETTLETLAATAPSATAQIEFSGMDGMSICSILHSRRQHVSLESYKEGGFNLLIGLKKDGSQYHAHKVDGDTFIPAEHASAWNYILVGKTWNVPCKVHSRNEAGENVITETDLQLTYSDHNPAVWKNSKHFVPIRARFQNFQKVKSCGWLVGQIGAERFLIAAKNWNSVQLGDEVSWCGMNAAGHFDICFRRTSESAAPELPI